ncbi:phytanoyl-CoA dioxygenase family protein [Acinetobacter sp. MD2]|uniref:phytanoyl-CoA dioxygenase family protein n=1 Tax=Acinetobacter sp. MD2 TaxID=2600066 RepID=UPI002D1F6637|nr:phytanoyl-CoA dioxygenase family protein [Acinetobacter sp. MD2]MEB3766879.1 phytanoyl-CoA dioxygenase family protein [Acinetobacter sp. MD2]
MQKPWLKIKNWIQDQRTQTALTELQRLIKQNPKQMLRDSVMLLSEAKSFDHNLLINSPVLNQLGLHRFRVKTAAMLAGKRRARLAKFLSADEVSEFHANGFILKENFLAIDEFQRLQSELLNTALDSRETLQGDTVTRRMALDAKALARLPVTKKLLSNPLWQARLNYVGSYCSQPMYYVQVILSHVRQARPDPQTHLHSDTFHPNVKAWLFLTDVAEDEGPFVYVPGSHQVNPQRLAWEHQKACSMHNEKNVLTRRGSFRIQASKLAALGYAQPKAFAVKANTLVIADTYGFHARGPSVRPSTRIELWAYARRNPFLPWTGGDVLSSPWLKDHLVPLYWQGLDFLEKYKQRPSPWRAVGQKYATDPAVLHSKP